MEKSKRRPLSDITHLLNNNFSNQDAEGSDMEFTGDYSSIPFSGDNNYNIEEGSDMEFTGDYSSTPFNQKKQSILHRKSLTSNEYEKYVKSNIKKNRGQIYSNEDRNCVNKLFYAVSNLVKYNNNISRSIQQLTKEQIKFNREILEIFSELKRTVDGKKKYKSIRKRRSKKKKV